MSPPHLIMIQTMSSRRLFVSIGQLPPPVTGFSYITAQMIDIIRASYEVTTINLSPEVGRRNFVKHAHKLWLTLKACWRLQENDRSPRLLYLGCEGNWGLIYTALIVLMARMRDYKIFLHHHSFSYIHRPIGLMRLVLAIGGAHIRHIFLCSTMLDQFSKRYGVIADARIISNAAFVPPKSYEEFKRDLTAPIRIGLLSNLTKEKGLHIFLDLLRMTRISGLDVVGVLAGPIADANDRAQVMVAKHELGSALEYLGPIYGEAKDIFYRDLDVFVFPTEYANEAQPTVLFEALAAGNHIIAFDRGCIASQIGPSGTVISPTDDFSSLAYTYLQQLVRDREAFLTMREGIANRFQALHESALCAAQIFSLNGTETNTGCHS